MHMCALVECGGYGLGVRVTNMRAVKVTGCRIGFVWCASEKGETVCGVNIRRVHLVSHNPLDH